MLCLRGAHVTLGICESSNERNFVFCDGKQECRFAKDASPDKSLLVFWAVQQAGDPHISMTPLFPVAGIPHASIGCPGFAGRSRQLQMPAESQRRVASYLETFITSPKMS